VCLPEQSIKTDIIKDVHARWAGDRDSIVQIRQNLPIAAGARREKGHHRDGDLLRERKPVGADYPRISVGYCLSAGTVNRHERRNRIEIETPDVVLPTHVEAIERWHILPTIARNHAGQ